MSRVSRRQLARYAIEQLIAGEPVVDLARELAAELVDSGRASQTQILLNDISYELERRHMHVEATATAASEFSPELKKLLTDFIAEATDIKSVSLKTKIDLSVLGGVHIETASRSWDNTVRRQLDDLRRTFK